ncbi:MAG: GNAT family N-acetyltransferase [Cohnella sp.]|uniref:GNAT family N-acetyltransferase n=1 Tax=Cohnella sp. TaxID=1883426 RepID=UPI000E39F4A9|nr:GNAT family N-acetyltransferase [Cohnella sp.]REK68207.1 MAG: GNAT family N-acetyltransferase [Cohnella sp.]
MLIDIKHKLEEPEIQELIELSAYSDPEDFIQVYRGDDRLEIMGFYANDELAGLAGFRLHENGTLELNHIAVVPDKRGKGYGTAILLSLIGLKKPRILVAEIDEDAVDFYRSVGFTIESLGEKIPGIERFRCTYDCAVEEQA